jgi:hypothetical protein
MFCWSILVLPFLCWVMGFGEVVLVLGEFVKYEIFEIFGLRRVFCGPIP